MEMESKASEQRKSNIYQEIKKCMENGDICTMYIVQILYIFLITDCDDWVSWAWIQWRQCQSRLLLVAPRFQPHRRLPDAHARRTGEVDHYQVCNQSGSLLKIPSQHYVGRGCSGLGSNSWHRRKHRLHRHLVQVCYGLVSGDAFDSSRPAFHELSHLLVTKFIRMCVFTII